MYGLMLNNLCITCGLYKSRENVHTKLPRCPRVTTANRDRVGSDDDVCGLGWLHFRWEVKHSCMDELPFDGWKVETHAMECFNKNWALFAFFSLLFRYRLKMFIFSQRLSYNSIECTFTEPFNIVGWTFLLLSLFMFGVILYTQRWWEKKCSCR